jgi:replicative DNA helicase
MPVCSEPAPAETSQEPTRATLVTTGTEPTAEANVEPPARERYGAISAQQLFLDVLTDVNKPPDMGCPTGVGDIDVAMLGMRPETITVLGASTSMGKSSLAIMSSEETTTIGRKPLILTYEDAPILYGRRMVARRAKLNFISIRNRDTSMRERGEIIRAAGRAQTAPFLVDCRGKSAEYGAQVIREMVVEEGIDLVIIDYLQRIKTDHRAQDRRNQVTFAMAELSDAIKISGAAGLILSQLKRLPPGNIPSPEDLKESGDVECFTENIILGWREIQRDGRENKYAILAKAKDGPTIFDPIALKWNAVSACFETSDASHPADKNTDREMHRLHEDIDQAITGRY